MDRRRMLSLLAAGTAAVLTGCHAAQGESAVADEVYAPEAVDPPVAPPSPLLRPPPGGPRRPIPAGTITALPGPGSSMALTVDDGVSSEVVGAYIRFARDTGARLTFFVTACYDSWHVHRDELRPLVEAGQIQLANHTWAHADLTAVSESTVADELSRCKLFLHNTFGVTGAPYYRPPFGRHNATVDRIAGDLGYTVPVMWYGSLSDSGLITEQYLVECAHKYFNPQTIVIGHANFPPVTRCYRQLVDIVRERALSLVTLDDVLTVV
ncbi:polysaccharide deacetylase family protein [Nocardia sp. NBC_01329]|uniref:polysaccharide deacetylase family protein n=1 Tax=Nocardia sp. NBC_01329 TaxID=2903594 RepID=UPI002E114BDF|nr:polysaccharide deacetylase family protein [Nocardia sp. NBC_01329]